MRKRVTVKRSGVENLSNMQVITVASISDDAIAVEEVLSSYLDTQTQLVGAFTNAEIVFAETARLRKALNTNDAPIGRELILAYANAAVERRSKWCSGYNKPLVETYRHMAEAMVKNLKVEFSIKSIPVSKWAEFLHDNEQLYTVLRRLECLIKDALIPTNEWGIIFAELDGSLLKLVDYGDYRIHQWEANDGIDFRKRNGLNPARGILR